jgi:hypothetical protein
MTRRESPSKNPDGPMQLRPRLSIDWWSVITALSAAILIKFGILPHIPW